MNREKLSTYAHLIVCIAGAVLLGYFFAKYVLLLFLPFLVAWGAAFAVRPLAEGVARRTRLSVRLCRVLLTVLCLLLFFAVLGGLLVGAGAEAWRLLSGLGDGEELAEKFLAILRLPVGWFGDTEAGAALAEQVTLAFGNALSTLLSGAVAFLSGAIAVVPRVFLFLIICAIASVYFSFDLEHINAAVRGKLPEKAARALIGFKDGFLHTLVRYLRSYLMIMAMTFAIMLTGFLLLGIRYALLAAIIVALLDMLPVIGVGTVLVPWSVFTLVSGNTGLAVGLFLLFAANELIRQFTEPKIVGRHLGIHPLLTLIFLYVGYALFGVLGLLLIPIATVAYQAATRKGGEGGKEGRGKDGEESSKDEKEESKKVGKEASQKDEKDASRKDGRKANGTPPVSETQK